MITTIYRNFPTIQKSFGKTFLSGHLFKFSGLFFFPILNFLFEFFHDAKDQQALALVLAGVLTTRPHSTESRPEIQKSSGGRWGTRHGGGLLFPRLLLSRSDVTIALLGT